MKKKLFLLFLASTAFTACKKDKDNSGGDNGPDVIKYIASISEKSADGTTVTQQFTWNAQHQLTRLQSNDGDIRELTYDTGGRLVKLVANHTDAGTVDEYTFTYTTAGLPEKYKRHVTDNDGLDGTADGTYTITGGKVTKIIERNPATGDEAYMNFTYAGNNISKITLLAGKNGTPDPATEAVSTFTYGAKKNPLGGMQLPYALLSTELPLLAFSPNETKSMSMKLGNISFSSTATYQYDAQGYPTSSETKEEDNSEVIKVTYQYK